jgi:hypothetical protein
LVLRGKVGVLNTSLSWILSFESYAGDLWLDVMKCSVSSVEEEVEAFAEEVFAFVSGFAEVVEGGDFAGGFVGVVGELCDEAEEAAVGVGEVEVSEGVDDEVVFGGGGGEVECFVGVCVEPVVGVGVAAPEVEGVVSDADAKGLVRGICESELFVEVVFDFLALVGDEFGDAANPAGAMMMVGAELGEEEAGCVVKGTVECCDGCCDVG